MDFKTILIFGTVCGFCVFKMMEFLADLAF